MKLEILEQLCSGLEHAHKAGVVHRDIKPANLIIDPEATLKILDFGVAKPPATPQGGEATPLTSAHVIMGTPGYMSPEQYSGATVDYRSDMFAAAVVAFELLSGRKPFGTTPGEVATRVARGDIEPLTAGGVGVPSGVRDAVLRGLAVRPEDRHADMASMRRAFAEAREGLAFQPDVRFAPFNEARYPWRRLAASLAVATLALGAVWWFSSRPATVTPGAVQVTTDSPPSDAVALPSGTLLADTDPPPGDQPAARLRSVRTDPIESRVDAGASPPRDTNTRTQHSPNAPLALGSAALTDAVPAEGPQAHPPAPADKSSQPSLGPTGPPVEAPRTPTVDENAIRTALRALEAAFREASTPALKQVFPAMTSDQLNVWDRRFLDNASYTLRVQGEQLLVLSADRVQVNCTLAHMWVPKQGQPRQRGGRATILLQRAGSEWLVASIFGPGW